MFKSKVTKKALLITFGVLSWASMASAQEIYDAQAIQPNSATKVSMEEFIKKIPKGAIVVIGEQHNFPSIQQGQLAILDALRANEHKINIGMEFLRYTDQPNVDALRSGAMSEDDFKKSSWGDADFNVYRDQILFPKAKNGERTFAINSPKELPILVKTKGLVNLSQEEKALLPPNFQLGRASYKKRFIESMKNHVADKKAMTRYFETQSVWDDTMAWKVCEAKGTSDNTLVLVVGQFHVEYGDGLIDRIRARCGKSQPIVSVFEYLFFNEEEINFGEFVPSPKYGKIADYLMIVRQE